MTPDEAMAGERPACADLLETIVAATRRRVEVAAERVGVDALRRRAEARSPNAAAFRDALAHAGRVNVIAECKRRSPSRGVIRPEYDPTAIARGYEAAGAAAVSVLTEPTFFDGSLDHLSAVRDAVALPILRKDFIISTYQVLEARAAGADALLLIVAALDEAELGALIDEARQSGLACLVEVHDEVELARALDAGAGIVGVNNRNLRTLATDTRVSERLARAMPDGIVRVAESGLRSLSDLQGLKALGYDAFLIGESLMARPDPGMALRELLSSAPQAVKPRSGA